MSITRPKEGWNVQRVRTHPGEILREEFMKPLGLSANRLALDLHVPVTRISEIIHERRSISADTALRLARYFGTDAEYWLRFQMAHDLSKARLQSKNLINKQVPIARAS
ncbi:MAG: HigA family addiction module antidote protein [Acidobacteriaceae bacterium]|nr:HigA family addiction module antidote protein [Acidobacteriaceae bacterium]MBV9678662.1 HigA family addiction module antidote protein [Acidobacteriaceae bacterium]